VIVGIVIVTGAVVILANIAADLLSAAIDPRVRGQRSNSLGAGDTV
jgi:ABC-type dipeptide/oligopeptide/nickel transport system permease component